MYMHKSQRPNEHSSERGGATGALVGTVTVLLIIGGIWWFVFGTWLDSDFMMIRGFINGIWQSWLFPNGWNIFAATPFFTVVASLIIIAIAWLVVDATESNAGVAIIVTIVLALVSLHAVFVRGWWMGEESGANHYLSTTSFVVHDTNKLPGMLTKFSTSGEAKVKAVQGELPSGWVPRVASATGAQNVIGRTSDAINNTELMSDTLTYVYGEGQSGVWTAIRDGKNQQAIYGIHSWNGDGENIETCEFKGDYELNQAFGGLWDTNLGNTIAQQYPQFTFDDSDMWGYCDDGKPIIVIPGTKTVGHDVRTVDQANGVLTIVGSPDGTPIITHDTEVKAGEYPGPVYPQRLVNQQLNSVTWGAGRHLASFENFGFEATNVSSQGNNNRNYLLKSAEDGRLYWVTPLKPRSTDSQTLIAYSVTPADTANADLLNEQKVFILDDNDPRIVNLDNLQAKVIDEVRTKDPGFFTGETPGRIVEFLPISDDKWQVFAEVNGRVKYRIDVTVGSHISANVVQIDNGTAQPASPNQPQTSGTSCDDPSSLDTAKLAQCLSNLANELQKRQTAPAK
jgi:hypothetical protein